MRRAAATLVLLTLLAACGVDGRPVPPGVDPDAVPVENTPDTLLERPSDPASGS